MPLDVAGLKPLDTSGLKSLDSETPPGARPGSTLNTAGLKPLDTSKLKALGAPPPEDDGETDEQRAARYREESATGVPIPAPSTRKEREAWGPTIRSIPENVRATLAQTMAGMYAREFADLEQAAAAGGLHGPDVRGKTPEEAAAIARGYTERELATAREAQDELDRLGQIPQTLGQRAVVNAASSVAQSAPAMAAGMLTRNPSLAAASMMPVTSGQQFAQYSNLYADQAQERESQGWPKRTEEERKQDLQRAALHGDIQGLIEGGTELLPFRELFKPGSGFAARLIDTLAEELPGESIATITQTIDDTIAKDPQANTRTVLGALKEVWKGTKEGASQLPDTWAATILQSTLMAGAVSAAERRTNADTVPEVGHRPIAPPPGGAAAPEQPPEPTPESLAPKPGEEVERYQFMRNPREGTSLQMEVMPLTQERFVKYVRPMLVQGYANTLEEFQAKNPDATHIALTRKSEDGEWRPAWWASPQGIMDRMRQHETKVRQVKDFDSQEAKDWAAIDETTGAKRDLNALDAGDSLAVAISKLGGLSREEAESHGIDPAEFGRRGAGIKRVFTENGQTAEQLAEILHDRGYKLSDGGTYSGQVLIDKLHDELAGRSTALTDRGMEKDLEQQARERAVAEEQRYRSQRETEIEDYYANMPEAQNWTPADRTLGEPEDYPADFDREAKSLADLAVLARNYASDDDVQDAMITSSDAKAARALQEIIRNGRAKEERQRARATEQATPREPVAAPAPEGQGAAAAAPAVEPIKEQPKEVKSDESQGRKAQENVGRGGEVPRGEGTAGREVSPAEGAPAGEPERAAGGRAPTDRSATQRADRDQADNGGGAGRGGNAGGETRPAVEGPAVREKTKADVDAAVERARKRRKEGKREQIPGFENAAFEEEKTTGPTPSEHDTRHYVEIEPGKKAIVDYTPYGFQIHSKWASQTGFRSVTGVPTKVTGGEIPLEKRDEAAWSAAWANYEEHKKEPYAKFSGAIDKAGPKGGKTWKVQAQVTVPHWIGKPVLDVLHKAGFKPIVWGNGTSQPYNLGLDTGESENNRLKSALGPILKKGTLFNDEDELAKALKESLEKSGYLKAAQQSLLEPGQKSRTAAASAATPLEFFQQHPDFTPSGGSETSFLHKSGAYMVTVDAKGGASGIHRRVPEILYKHASRKGTIYSRVLDRATNLMYQFPTPQSVVDFIDRELKAPDPIVRLASIWPVSKTIADPEYANRDVLDRTELRRVKRELGISQAEKDVTDAQYQDRLSQYVRSLVEYHEAGERGQDGLLTKEVMDRLWEDMLGRRWAHNEQTITAKRAILKPEIEQRYKDIEEHFKVGKAKEDKRDSITLGAPVETANYQVDPAVRAASEELARRQGGQYSAVARRLKPWSVEKGFGDTPELAQRNALRRVGDPNWEQHTALTPHQKATREAIGFASEKIEPGEMAPPQRDEDILSVEFGGKSYEVASLEDAQKKWIAFRDQSNAGASEIGDGVVVKDGLGREVGRISYNGRIWDAYAKKPQNIAPPQPVVRSDSAVGPTLADLKKNLEDLKVQEKAQGRVVDSRLLERISNIERLIAEHEAGPTQKEIDAAAHEAATSPKNALPQPTQAQKEAENYKVGEPTKLYGVTWRVENPKGSYRFKLDERELTGLWADLPPLRTYLRNAEFENALKLLRDGKIPGAFEALQGMTDRLNAAANEDKAAKKYARTMNKIMADSWHAKLAAHYARALGVPAFDGDTLDAFIGPNAADQALPVYVIDTNKLGTSDFDEHKVMLGFESEAAARKVFADSYNGDVGNKILRSVTPMSPQQFEAWIAKGGPAQGPAAEVSGERANAAQPESGQPAGAQPEPVSPSRADEETGRVRGDEGAGGASGTAEPSDAWLHGRRGVGSGADGILETAGQSALDFAVDRRPERELEPRVDGRSAEVKRAKEHGSAAPTNYVITPEDEIGKGGAKTKAKQNIAAIRIVKAIAGEQRAATSEEQAQLVKYVGWGGLPQIFDEEKADWAKERAELKELLTADEYAAARRSTQDAHYTSETVIRGMYSALERLGFTGGKVLEPAAGIGHFFGMMPEALRSRAQAAGVELDPLTAQIANALYPKIKTSNMGFQDFGVPDGYYDAVVGNPPFGDQKLYDGERKHLNDFSIHNYFIAKAVDVTRPGGVVAVVVSRYFMDSSNVKARAYIAKHATLLGAIRLPNTAFADNANTEVVTDIVFLQKKHGEAVDITPDWVEPQVMDLDGTKVTVNPYFVANPAMVLGKHALTGSMYRGNEYTVEPTGGLETQLRTAVQSLPQAVIPPRAETHQQEVEKAAVEPVDMELVRHVQVYGFFEKDGAIYQRVPDQAGEAQGERVDIDGPSKERMLQLIKVRDLVRSQLRMELSDSPGMEANRRQLNQAYDRLVKKFGYVHAQGNKNLFSDDPSYPLLLSLESDYDKGVSATTAKAQGVSARSPSADKAAIFRRRVLVPFHSIEKVNNATDALMSSLAEHGNINETYIEKVYGKPFAEVMGELGDRVYELHDGSGWVTADEYLSGNVKAKLKEATAAARRDARFQRNVQALTRVIPADLDPVDIDVNAGSPWVPARHMQDFARHLFGNSVHAQITYVPAMGKFSARIMGGDRVLVMSKWGTERVSGTDLLTAVLTNSNVVVYDRTADDTRVVNQDATLAAQDKLESIKREFEEWIWQDEARRTDVARIYNDTFNTDVEQKFDGSHLGVGPEGRVQPLHGMSPEVTLRPHQKNYVWRFIQTGKALADHVVGAGKTFAAIAAVMERKRIGLINKPMFVVPNHLTEQWGSDFTKLYPGANVLVATKKDFEKANRRKFFAKIATGNWDAVIVAHSSFERIEMPVEALEKFVNQQMADLTASQEALKASGSRDRRSVKQMEKAKERLQSKLKARIEGKAKDNVVGLDELGVDALVVDEAHAYKNLMYSTSRRNVAGLGNTEGSERAMDMFVKSQYILDRNGGQNLMYLTGTPVSNSIAEMYHVQRYMDSDTLRARGLYHFDAWANTFASLFSDWEVSTSGVGMKQITRFRRFQNFAELMKMYRSFADVVTQDDLKKMREAEGKPPLTPPVAGGGPQAIAVPASPAQRMYMAEIVKRAEELKSKKNDGDNMLLITTHARQAALDMRLRDPGADDYDGSKVAEAARRIKAAYDRWHQQKGTQLVFIDLSTPKNFQSEEQRRIADIIKRAEDFEPEAMEQMAQLTPDEIASASATFDVYNDLKAKLVALGIPEREIEFIHQANTELRKEALYERVRQGVTRVLFGSTAKMGAGMNVQRRLVALHHLDAPWKPSDLEQREGRIIRQGNMFYDGDPDRRIAPVKDFAVEINRYVTKGTYDARAWQVLENKARFIGQMRSANMNERRVEDIAGEAATAAAMKAAASDNPLIEEEVRLRGDIRKLEVLKRDHTRKEHGLQAIIRGAATQEAEGKRALELFDQDVAAVQPQPEEGFAGMEVGGRQFQEKKAAGMAIALQIAAFIKSKRDSSENVGTYRGFPFFLAQTLNKDIALVMPGKAHNYQTVFPSDQAVDPIGAIQRLDNLLDKIPQLREQEQRYVEKRRQEVETARKEVGQPFKQQEELDAKIARHREVLKSLQEKKTEEAGQSDGLEAHMGDVKTRRRGLGVKVIEPFVNDIVSQWKGLRSQVIVTSRNGGMSRVPANVQRGIAYLDPQGRMMGLNDSKRGVIYLFADNLPSLSEAERILIHEAKGHAGAHAYLGDEYEKWRDRGLELFPAIAEEQAAHTGADMRTTAGRNRVGDEIFAVLAEHVERGTATAKMQEFMDRLYHAVLRFLESIGLRHYRPTRVEFRNMIRAAADEIEHGSMSEGVKPTRFASSQQPQAALGGDQADTPEFKRWFKDSKVATGDGRPMIVFHSTRSGTDFSAFKIVGGDIGMHFGTAGQAEDRFVSTRPSATEHGRPRTIPVYLSIQKPLYLPDLESWDFQSVKDAIMDERGPLAEAMERDELKLKSAEDVRKWLEAHGYDGIQYPNAYETGGSVPQKRLRVQAIWDEIEALAKEPKSDANTAAAERLHEEYNRLHDEINVERQEHLALGVDSYIAFRPTQIKSAVGNSGEFNPDVADITAALSDPDNEEELSRVRADEAATRQKGFFERVLRDGQPIDETFALLMRPFGTLDDRRVFQTHPQLKAAGRAAMNVGKEMLASKPFRWMHGYVQSAHNAINERYNVDAVASAAIETAKRGLIDRYGQSEELRIRSHQVEADRRSMLLMGEDLLTKLLNAGVESKEAEIMYRMMTADGTTPEEKAALGEDIQKLAPEIRETLDHIGREYVELGLLSAETFEFWRGSYLPRSYLKYEQERGSLARFAGQVLDRRRKRIIGRQFQQRGIEITKSQARILKDVPEGWWGRRKEEGQSDGYLKGAHFVVLERVTAEGDLTIDMPGVDPKHIEERVTARVYWPAELPIPEKWRGYANRGTFVVRAAERGNLALWRDWTREERERMTEIVDVRYALAKAFMQASNDISTGRYFRDIAVNPDWASTTDPTGNSPNASEHLWSTQAGAEWVRVPETKAPGTNAARYGALSGMYVRAEVWNDINQTVQMQKAGFWKYLLTQWKLNKTARNPVVHLNNIMSNFLLMDLVDVRARDLVRGIRSYIEKDAYYRSALEHGALGADIVTQELTNTLLGPVLKQLEAQQRAAGHKDMMLLEAVGTVTRALRSADAWAQRIYQFEDEVFRMATYMREIERGATPAEAANHAREQFLNYDIKAPWINAMRQSLVPFLAYTYRAVPIVAKSIADRPWKLAKYFSMAWLFNMLAYALMDDDDEDEERATLRPEEQGFTWLGMERMLRAPFNDRFGNPVFWDIRRFIPAGDVFDVNQGSSAIGVPAPLQFGGPLAMAFELMLNKQGFTGEPITNDLTDTTGEKVAKIGDYLWKSLAPSAPWIPGSWYWSKIRAAATGELDPLMREYSVPLAVSSAFGLKFKPHDVALQRRYQLMDADRVERALTEQARDLAIDLRRQRISREYYDQQAAVIQQKLRRLADRRRELAPR